MNKLKLAGKIALITGGTSGMGATTAKPFQAEGATAIVTGGSNNGVDAARQTMPEIEVIKSDAGDPAAAKALVKQVKGKHGRIDVLLVYAGIARLADLEQVDEALFDRTVNINLRGPYFLLKYAAPVLSDSASVILMTSTAAVLGMAGASATGQAKRLCVRLESIWLLSWLHVASA